MRTPGVVELPTKIATQDPEVVEVSRKQTEIATQDSEVAEPSRKQTKTATRGSEVVDWAPTRQAPADIQKGALQATLMMAIANILRQKCTFP